jgi:chromosomal replication initiation ATPase DnaA
MLKDELDDALSRYVEHHTKAKSSTAKNIEAISRLVQVVCQEEKLLPYQVFSKRRTTRMVNVRSALFCVLVDGGFSYSEIGRLTNRSHSTVMEAVRERPQRSSNLYNILKDLFYAE